MRVIKKFVPMFAVAMLGLLVRSHAEDCKGDFKSAISSPTTAVSLHVEYAVGGGNRLQHPIEAVGDLTLKNDNDLLRGIGVDTEEVDRKGHPIAFQDEIEMTGVKNRVHAVVQVERSETAGKGVARISLNGADVELAGFVSCSEPWPRPIPLQ